MKRVFTVVRAAAFSLAIATMFASGTMFAQASKPSPRTETKLKRDSRHDLSDVEQKAIAEIGSAVTEYWMPKLNEYKVRIDRSLSPEDLNTLNTLRVRFAILTSQLMKSTKALALGADSEKTELEVDPESFMKKASEAMEIYKSAKEMAERYRAPLDRVKESVVTDVTDFAGKLEQRSSKFFETNRVDIVREKGEKFITEGQEGLAKLAADLRTEKGQKGIAVAYTSAIEPIVLLYNGGDLGQMFNQLAPMNNAIASTGITMPENSALKQNIPNPASTTTKIVYDLSSASSATTIRLYSSTGSIAATFDDGAQGVGHHERSVDVSNLPNGTYLCHLTVQTENGERVYSRAMQIVR